MLRLLLATLFVAIPADAQSCSVETDEFTGKESVRCEPVEVTVEQHPDHEVWQAKGYAMKSEGTILLGVMAYPDSWNFLSVEKVYALIDGERATFRAIREGETISRSVAEQVAMKVPRGEAQKIAQADTIRVKIESAVFDVSAVRSQMEYVIKH